MTGPNECLDSTQNDCHEHAACTDITAGYTCECNAGYTGDGQSCTG